MEVGVHAFKHTSGRTVYLIDTPGFDDTNRTDTDVLRDLADFLGATYKKGIKLAGIIYLHAITDNRMRGSQTTNLTLFQELCGTESMSNVVLATTMWDKLTTPDQLNQAIAFEKELHDTPRFWGDMVDEGSRIMRQNDGFRSALEIVNHILSLRHGAIMTIQRELIDQKKPLNETRAGEEVQKDLIRERKKHQKEMAQLEDATQKAIARGNEEQAKKLLDMQTEYRAKLQKSDEDMVKLKEDFEKVQKDKDEKHQRDLEQIRKECKGYQDEIKKNESQIDLINKRHKQTEEEMLQLRKESGDKDKEMQAALEKMREKHDEEIDELRRRNEELQRRDDSGIAALGLLSALGGVLTAGAGVLTVNPLLVGLGGTMIVGGAAGAVGSASKSG
jgi:hypothetical protein